MELGVQRSTYQLTIKRRQVKKKEPQIYIVFYRKYNHLHSNLTQIDANFVYSYLRFRNNRHCFHCLASCSIELISVLLSILAYDSPFFYGNQISDGVLHVYNIELCA